MRGLVQRADGVELARITVYLDPAVAQKLRRHCFENSLQVSDTAAEAITVYVDNLFQPPASASAVQPPAASVRLPAVQPSAASVQAPAPKVRGLVQRADGVELARITVYLDPAVAQKLRRHCFENSLQVSDTAAEAITIYVDKL
ncbi:MAG: hypothetical protein ACMG6S_03530 [Byssovorax sp.]